jgi:hypothetical protein
MKRKNVNDMKRKRVGREGVMKKEGIDKGETTKQRKKIERG